MEQMRITGRIALNNVEGIPEGDALVLGLCLKIQERAVFLLFKERKLECVHLLIYISQRCIIKTDNNREAGLEDNLCRVVSEDNN